MDLLETRVCGIAVEVSVCLRDRAPTVHIIQCGVYLQKEREVYSVKFQVEGIMLWFSLSVQGPFLLLKKSEDKMC